MKELLQATAVQHLILAVARDCVQLQPLAVAQAPLHVELTDLHSAMDVPVMLPAATITNVSLLVYATL